MTSRCCAFLKDDLHPCKKNALKGKNVCHSHRNFYKKQNWLDMFCRPDSKHLPTGFGYPSSTYFGRLEETILYALENNLIVLTQEDCAAFPSPPPNEWVNPQLTLVDLWTILVKSGKVSPHWNKPLTKLAMFTFAGMRMPNVLDIAPSLDDRIGCFLNHRTLNPYNLLLNVLGCQHVLMKFKEFSSKEKSIAFAHVIQEFVRHPAYQPCLLLSTSLLTQNLYTLPEKTMSKDVRGILVDAITSVVKPEREKLKKFHHTRAELFKEELVAKAFHPKRVEKWLEEGGQELLDMMF